MPLNAVDSKAPVEDYSMFSRNQNMIPKPVTPAAADKASGFSSAADVAAHQQSNNATISSNPNIAEQSVKPAPKAPAPSVDTSVDSTKAPIVVDNGPSMPSATVAEYNAQIPKLPAPNNATVSRDPTIAEQGVDTSIDSSKPVTPPAPTPAAPTPAAPAPAAPAPVINDAPSVQAQTPNVNNEQEVQGAGAMFNRTSARIAKLSERLKRSNDINFNRMAMAISMSGLGSAGGGVPAPVVAPTVPTAAPAPTISTPLSLGSAGGGVPAPAVSAPSPAGGPNAGALGFGAVIPPASTPTPATVNTSTPTTTPLTSQATPVPSTPAPTPAAPAPATQAPTPTTPTPTPAVTNAVTPVAPATPAAPTPTPAPAPAAPAISPSPAAASAPVTPPAPTPDINNQKEVQGVGSMFGRTSAKIAQLQNLLNK